MKKDFDNETTPSDRPALANLHEHISGHDPKAVSSLGTPFLAWRDSDRCQSGYPHAVKEVSCPHRGSVAQIG
jgi:hypothetical protein